MSSRDHQIMSPSHCSRLTGAFLACFVISSHLQNAKAGMDWQWRQGRASWYGDDSWSIDIGGCGYGYIWQDEGPTGWDVAAITDVNKEYVDSCGSCVEIKCDNTHVKDGYGNSYDRSGSCFDSSKSVVVRIVDTCPCTYPANSFSNRRWCCGDNGVDHFDISKWAFEKLAELRWGVIGLQYRQVPCNYQPSNSAPKPSRPSPPVPAYPPSNAKRRTRDWPDYRSSSIVTRLAFEDNYNNGFYDASYGASVTSLSDSKNQGMMGGQGLCGTIYSGGAISLKSYNGVFQNTVALEFWTYVGKAGWEGTAAKVPDIAITIGGNKGTCNTVRLINLKPFMFQPKCTYCDDYYWGYKIYLPVFSGSPTDTVINDPNNFGGCGGNGVWDLNTIMFKNEGYTGGNIWMCLDHIMLA